MKHDKLAERVVLQESAKSNPKERFRLLVMAGRCHRVIHAVSNFSTTLSRAVGTPRV